jgi:SAM-dependent methyltransferase
MPETMTSLPGTSSFDRPSDPAIAPSPWVLRWQPLFKPGGRVLDVAAGHGRHARVLAQVGFKVTAVDVDVSGLQDMSDNVAVVAADLEADAWPFASRSFDVIVMTNYLHRPHFPHLVESLAPGGVLVIETFGQGNQQFGRPRNSAFLLEPGELLAAFAPHLNVTAYQHGAEHRPRPAVRQRICAIKSL